MLEFLNKDECTGCTACASICPNQCILMKEDYAGFLFPELADTSRCIDCGVCKQVCPVLRKKSIKGAPIAYAAYSENKLIRSRSSSGGIFSEIASLVLGNGGYICGAGYDQDGTVKHILIKDESNLDLLRGAKYSQSVLEDSFREIKKILDTGKEVLFSGLPCQVAGLKSFLRKNYSNLICVDFVCHGVPSPMVWEKYVKYRAAEDNWGILPKAINMRNKESGWSHYSYSSEFIYSNTKRYICQNDKDLFMNLFVGNYILRECCGNCHFKGYARESDITLADFWGIWDIDLEMDDNKGTSLVLVHTEKGEKLFKSKLNTIKYKQVTLEQASLRNPSLLSSAIHKENRENILMAISRSGFETAKSFTKDRRRMRDIIKETINKVLKK